MASKRQDKRAARALMVLSSSGMNALAAAGAAQARADAKARLAAKRSESVRRDQVRAEYCASMKMAYNKKAKKCVNPRTSYVTRKYGKNPGGTLRRKPCPSKPMLETVIRKPIKGKAVRGKSGKLLKGYKIDKSKADIRPDFKPCKYGSRVQVMRGTALSTRPYGKDKMGLTREKLMRKNGRIVPKAKSAAAKKAGSALAMWRKAVKQAGFGPTEGKFTKLPKKGSAGYQRIKAIYSGMRPEE